MPTAIVFCSRHGTTEKVVKYLANRLDESVDIFNLSETEPPSIERYNKVIIGGSIHFGQIQSAIRNFCDYNKRLLLNKEFGLFICCMLKEKEQEEFNHAYPQILRDYSKASGVFGGELLYDKMSFVDKIITKMVTRTSKSTIGINYDAIDHFAEQMKAPKMQPEAILH